MAFGGVGGGCACAWDACKYFDESDCNAANSVISVRGPVQSKSMTPTLNANACVCIEGWRTTEPLSSSSRGNKFSENSSKRSERDKQALSMNNIDR